MSKLDVLLVNPPTRDAVYQNLSQFAAIENPVWAGLIARYLMNQGHSVEILDAEAEGFEPIETAGIIESKEPRLAVFCIYGHQPSASTQCMPGAIRTLEMMEVYQEDFGAKDIPTAALGTHPSSLPQRTLRDGFDYVIQGEGPYTLAALTTAIRHTEPKHLPTGLWPKGLWAKDKLPPVPAPLIDNLDQELPSQAFELLDLKKYRPLFWHKWTGKNDSYASVQTSLGCPYACEFCCINAPFGKRGYRMWSANNVVDQIQYLVEHEGVTNIKIPDEMFVLNKKHVWDICHEIRRRRLSDDLNMWAYARVDTVKDEQLLEYMRAHGFRWLGIGIESADSNVRDGVSKGEFTDIQVVESVKRVQNAGLHVGANYIFGLPDDNETTMQATLDLALEINAEHSNFYCAMAYPGSPLHKMFSVKFPWTLPEAKDGPGWIGYSQHAYESRPLDTDQMKYTDVLDFRDKAWMKYHDRTEYFDLLRKHFGTKAISEMQMIINQGQPRRRHREVR